MTTPRTERRRIVHLKIRLTFLRVLGAFCLRARLYDVACMILGCSKQYSTRETFQSKSLRRGMNSELGDTFTPMRSMSFLGLSFLRMSLRLAHPFTRSVISVTRRSFTTTNANVHLLFRCGENCCPDVWTNSHIYPEVSTIAFRLSHSFSPKDVSGSLPRG